MALGKNISQILKLLGSGAAGKAARELLSALDVRNKDMAEAADLLGKVLQQSTESKRKPVPTEPILEPGSYQTRRRGTQQEPPLPGQESPWTAETPTPQSSNVYSFSYDPQTSTLYVTYQANALNPDSVSTGTGPHGGRAQLVGKRGSTVKGKTGQRGPQYAYFDVPARVHQRMKLAQSKGKFVWDELRVRGSIHGHKYRYSLVAGSVTIQQGLSGVYIPRKATKKGFVVRSVADVGTGRRSFQSSTLPSQRGHSTRRR